MKKRKRRRRTLTPLGAGLLLCICLMIFGGLAHLSRLGKAAGESELATENQTVAATETGAPSAPVEPTKVLSVALQAPQAYVLETDNDAVLLDLDGETSIAPASTTKLLTALTALDICSPDQVLTLGEEVGWVEADASRAWLSPGDTLTVRALLSAMLLPSGNDAAWGLAVYAGRRLAQNEDLPAKEAADRFVTAMNEKAAALGATDSAFVRPDGYDAEGQTTTAHDLALIGKACLENETLAEIVKSVQRTDTWEDGHEATYDNTNLLLNPDSAYYDKRALGLKTGSSALAGYCLVSAACIQDKTYVCVVLGETQESDRWTDTLALFQAIAEN